MRLGIGTGVTFWSTVALMLGITWANNLLGSTDTNQVVIGLTGTGGKTTIASTSASLEWDTATTAPNLTLANNATNGATAQPLSILGANATGTTSTGGRVDILGGTGTSANGGVRIGDRGAVGFASTGTLRFQKVPTINALNNAGSGDVQMLTTDTSDRTIVGTSSLPSRIAGNAIQITTASGTGWIFTAASLAMNNSTAQEIIFNEASTAAMLYMGQRTGNNAANTLTLRGSNASATGTGANKNGGFAHLQGGARLDNTGRRGGVRIQLDTSTTQTMLEACDVQAENTKPSRVLSLVRTSAITTTEMPSDTGDLVIYIGNCAVAPSANPVSGGILYVESGALKYRGTSGTVTTLGNA
jgi:hypothetical protein